MTQIGRPALRRYAEPGLIAAAIAAVYLLVQPVTGDHAAQAFRVGIFEQEGLSAWSNLWFGGHHLPGYSLLFPPLAGAIGDRLVGSVAMVVGAILFAAIVYERWGERARVGVVWFAAATVITLVIGRLTFALGVPFALGAVLAAQRGHRVLAISLAALCPLASPVAALFLAAVGVAYSLAERRREGLEIAAAAAGVALLVSLVFPEGGSQPFSASSFWPALVIALVTLLTVPREERLVIWGIATYALILVAAFLVETPMGSNALRMGSMLLGPLLACVLWRHNKVALVALVPLIVWWQASPVVHELEKVYAEPSVNAGYYAPVRDYLRGETRDQQYRVEVVPAAHHWEATYLPPRGIYIARGWERQLDQKLNSLFYEEPLRASEYRQWLDELGVGFVAVPDAPLDFAGVAEAELIERGLPYLELVFRSPDWEVYRVRDPSPLTVGAARLEKITPEGFVLKADAPGSVLVRIRWTPYWSLERGVGCVEESPGGFTRLRILEPGWIRVGVSFEPWKLLGGGSSCRGLEP